MERLNAIKLFVIINSAFIAFQGAVHGVYELLKGDIPTNGRFLDTIGAVTVLENYLHTGIAAIAISVIMLVLTMLLIDKRYFTPVFFVIGVLLFMFGGGVGFGTFFFAALAASTQKDKHYNWLVYLLKGKIGNILAPKWKILYGISFVSLAIGVLIWLFIIPPGIETETGIVHYICWSFLITGVLSMFPSILAGMAYDMRLRG